MIVLSLALVQPRNCVTVFSVYEIISSSIRIFPFDSGHPSVESTVTIVSFNTLFPRPKASVVL